jgi:cytochrome b561
VLHNGENSWGALAKLFHWVMAALILVQIPLGLAAVNWPLSPTKLDLFFWHKSTGVLLLVLAMLRVAWRLANRVPDVPPDTPAWERAAAHASHFTLYALLLAMPLTGWVVQSASNIPFRAFYLFPLPPIVAPDKALADLFKEVHEWLFVLLAIVLAVHVGAALRHHYFKRDPVLVRMLPGRWRTR